MKNDPHAKGVTSQVVLGLLVIGMGLLFLLDNLGFVDMHNIVLYRDLEQLREKLAQLRDDLALAERISRNGQQLVEQRYTFHALGQAITEAMRAPLRPAAKPGLLERVLLAIGLSR